MNNIQSIRKTVSILKSAKIDFALLHTTSMYPTPYDKVRLGALNDLKSNFPNTVIGLSDHSIGNYTCFAAIPYVALILEKHFTSNKKWKGPDIQVSIDPNELQQLIEGSKAIKQALDGKKNILKAELEYSNGKILDLHHERAKGGADGDEELVEGILNNEFVEVDE